MDEFGRLTAAVAKARAVQRQREQERFRVEAQYKDAIKDLHAAEEALQVFVNAAVAEKAPTPTPGGPRG